MDFKTVFTIEFLIESLTRIKTSLASIKRLQFLVRFRCFLQRLLKESNIIFGHVKIHKKKQQKTISICINDVKESESQSVAMNSSKAL